MLRVPGWRLRQSGPTFPIILKKSPKDPAPPPLPRGAPRLHRHAPGQGRHARDRARLRPEERRARRAQSRCCASLPTTGRSSAAARSCTTPGALPSVVLADITARDPDGELIAVPTEWDEEAHGAAPRIRIHVPRKARPAEIAGVGDRALLRAEETGEDGDAIRHTGRVIKISIAPSSAMLGIFRALPSGGGRLEPIDKKQLGRELAIPPGATARRAGRRSGRGRSRAAGPLRPADRACEGTARLAQERARGRA